MSRLDRAWGLARSIAIYHAIPFRQRRLRALYAHFVGAGDLVFDVGAHAGGRVRALASLGCRVIAVEPQPDFVRILRLVAAGRTSVTVVPAAVARQPGRVTLAVSDRNPTVSTASDAWRAARASDPDFRGVRWDRRVEVEATTLDALVDRFGPPVLLKIDIEGGEAEALAGLTCPVPVVSFEYLVQGLDGVEACVSQLARLGDYRFTWSPGESARLAGDAALPAPALLDALSRSGPHLHGDVYAVLPGFGPRARSR